MPSLSVSLDQIQKIRKIDSILFSYICIHCKREAFWQLPGRKRKKILVRFLLKVYIIVCYFSLIIFSTVELTLLAMCYTSF